MMWVIRYNDGEEAWTTNSGIADHARATGGTVTEVIPASEVREKDELIGRLADWIRGQEFNKCANARIEIQTAKSIADDFMLKDFGLRKTDGKWEKGK